MTEFEDIVRGALLHVAPDLEGEAIVPDRPFREQFELDSMDMLRMLMELGRRTGLDIPESDYPKLGSLADCVAYLASRGTRRPA
jgi:acyl carrier protein